MNKSQRIEAAKEYFESGYNCAQAVALAFSDIANTDLKTLEHAAAPFGGGVGRMREVCGAVSGMMLTLGLMRSSTDCRNAKEKVALYAEEQELAKRFKDKNGSMVCRELLAMANASHENPLEANAHKHSCVMLVEDAVEVLADYIDEIKNA